MYLLTTRRLLLAASVWLACGFSRPASAWDCGRALVNSGDSQQRVRHECGAPDFIYRSTGVYRRGRFIAVDEDWYYARGADRLVRRLHFHNAELQDVDTPGYGPGREVHPPCTPQDLRTGMTVYALLSRCGEPKSHREISKRFGGGTTRGQGNELVFLREEWLYDFGPDYLLQKVILSEGEVQEITSVSRHKLR